MHLHIGTTHYYTVQSLIVIHIIFYTRLLFDWEALRRMKNTLHSFQCRHTIIHVNIQIQACQSLTRIRYTEIVPLLASGVT